MDESDAYYSSGPRILNRVFGGICHADPGCTKVTMYERDAVKRGGVVLAVIYRPKKKSDAPFCYESQHEITHQFG